MITRLILAETLRAEIQAAVSAAHPHEACGLLIGQVDGGAATVEQIVVSDNLAADPTIQFEIDPKLLLHWHKAVRDSGQALLGPWHSHPSGPAVPSDCDRDRITEDGQIWLIQGVEGIAAWRADLPAKAFQTMQLL